jgi:tetratricopeptide (TPR) repeat protein
MWQMNRRLLALAAGLVLLTFAAHFPALDNGFIWDDDDHFTANSAMTSADGLRKIWTSLAVSRYYPFTLTTFWAQRRLWGLSPLPYHAVTIALHGVNAALLFVLLRKLEVRAAWVAAALWAVHPVNVESVAWITELKNTQSGAFFFLALLCFLEFEDRTKRLWGALSILCFAAAILSKPSAVVLPPILLLCAWWRRGRLTRGDFIHAAPFFALALAVSLLTIHEQQNQIDRVPHDWSIGFVGRFAVAGRAPWFYLWKTVWPANLMFVYPRWEINAHAPISFLPWLGTAVGAVALWRLRSRRWARACSFGLGYFVIALLPVLGFFDIFYFRYSFVADHFQYLASIGLTALVAAGAATWMPQRTAKECLAAVAIGLLGLLSWKHAQTFHDDETLWRDTLLRNPTAFLAQNNMGVLLLGRRQYADCEKYFRKAVRLKPHYLEGLTNLGLTLTALGNYAEAEQQLQEALRIQVDSWKAHYFLAHLYYLQKRPAESEREFRRAIVADPTIADSYYDLGNLLQEQHRYTEAVENYRKAIEQDSTSVNAYLALAKSLTIQGKYADAMSMFRRGLTVEPRHLVMRNELAWLMATAPDAAVRSAPQAIEISEQIAGLTARQEPRPLATLAAAYAEAGRFDEAVRTAKEATDLAAARHLTNLVAEIESQLRRYQQGKPYRLNPG